MNNIKALRTEKNLTQSRLAQLCGVHQTAVSQWEKGRTKPDTESLRILSQVLGASIDAILGGRDTTSGGIKIPVLGYVRAGIPVEAIEEVVDYEEISPSLAKSGEFFALYIKGNSMEPKMYEGDVVIVRKQADIDSGDVAVVLVNSMDATVKKVVKKGTGISLIPFNTDYSVMDFSAEDISRLPVSIVGKVVELRRKF